MELLTTREAAIVLRVSKALLEVWRCRGEGPAYLKFGKTVRYSREDLEKFIQDSRQYNTSS